MKNNIDNIGNKLNIKAFSTEQEEQFKKLIESMIKEAFVNFSMNPYWTAREMMDMIESVQTRVSNNIRCKAECYVDAKVKLDLNWRNDREELVK